MFLLEATQSMTWAEVVNNALPGVGALIGLIALFVFLVLLARSDM